MPESADSVDVLIVGAGPVGLVTAFQLAKFGGVSVRIIEKHVKSSQDAYGRAITLFPRTSEMLDQLSLADELLQHCFACRATVTYNAQGEEVQGRGWNFIDNMKDTAFDFALVLRQKYQEEIFRDAMGAYGVKVEAPVELTAVDVDEQIPKGGHRVTATLLHHGIGTVETVKCKYLVGADGGRSSVRRFLEIPFEGSTSEDKWVRVDGLIKTNLPKPRTYCSIESPTHGNVLWAALDRGATRIGYAFTEARANTYENFDEAAAVKEAIASVKPFTLEFERVDWWTIYTVGQRIAKSFFVQDCIFLAGDACHTHSSGAAQGMNTGIHDAVNLAWKLSAVLRGLAKPELLRTYQAERLPNVQRLIQYDKDISRLMTNRLPENWEGDPNADVNEILGVIMEKAGAFSSGLGIFYDVLTDNPLNREGTFSPSQGSLKPGMRAPDVTLLLPGLFTPIRLIRALPNTARFVVLIFAAHGSTPVPESVYGGIKTSAALQSLITRNCLTVTTILPKQAPSAYEELGQEALGRVYYDQLDRSAYERYGVEAGRGAVYVLRPDGWIGTMTALESGVVGELEAYFGCIFCDA
ncbi:FAD binding domain-containing protein [Xylariomycetidae sp. FL2044]|nr:FAD binding domain-containing protein [Xylariomycetidae sp. FL2044]